VIADCDKAIALKPDLAQAYGNRAPAWTAKEEYDKAWADVKRGREAGLEPHPNFLRALQKASGRQQ